MLPAPETYRVSALDRDGSEVARLGAQVDLAAGEERQALEEVGLPLRGRGAEVGCGPGFFAAGLIGPGRVIFGVDIDHGALMAARSRLLVVRGDAGALPVSPRSLDFVCARLLLRHVPDPGAVLAQMQALVRPGGRVLAIDGADSSLVVEPPVAGLDPMLRARREWFARRRCDPDVALALGSLLASAGLSDVRVRPVAMSSRSMGAGAFARTVLVTFVQAAEGVLGTDDPRLAEARAGVDRWATDPAATGSITLTVAGGLVGVP
jgi:SAM-dependent methyltransferase